MAYLFDAETRCRTNLKPAAFLISFTVLTVALLSSCANTGRSSSEGGDAGKEVVLRLEPSEDNPRNSEGSFVTLKDGRILFVYTHFTGGRGDHAQAHLAGSVEHVEETGDVDRVGGDRVGEGDLRIEVLQPHSRWKLPALDRQRNTHPDLRADRRGDVARGAGLRRAPERGRGRHGPARQRLRPATA